LAAAVTGTATRAMSVSVRRGTRASSAQSQYARRAVIQTMVFVLSRDSANVKLGGRVKIAQNAL